MITKFDKAAFLTALAGALLFGGIIILITGICCGLFFIVENTLNIVISIIATLLWLAVTVFVSFKARKAWYGVDWLD